MIAGASQMPLVIAREARRRGRSVLAVAIRGITAAGLEEAADDVVWLEWGDLPGFLAQLQRWRGAGVREAIMAGKVEQQRIYDARAGAGLQQVLEELPTRHTDALLGAVARVLEDAGIRLLESTLYLGPMLAQAGRVAGPEIGEAARADLRHGWRVAKALGELDIGQTVVVKERAVVAVEAMEGTDACIRRAGALAGAGCVVVKVAKPHQDLRYDVPVVGAQTLESMRAVGAVALGVEAGVTVLFDRQRVHSLAEEAGIAVVGLEGGAMESGGRAGGVG